MELKAARIIGNGPGDLPPTTEGRPHVTFNQASTSSLQLGEIRITNRKVGGMSPESPPFVVTSESFAADWCRALQKELAVAAAELMLPLGCQPSAGLTTVRVLSGMGVPLELYRMPLCPSLQRLPKMPARTPLSAAFHNWLGERRLAWQWWEDLKPTCCWPQLYLPADSLEKLSSDSDNPFPVLYQWFTQHAGRPSGADVETLRWLASLPPTAWYSDANKAQLQALENFFFLLRDDRETPNWWLYCNGVSKFIDTIHLRLMQAQQHLAFAPAVG